MGRKLLEEVVRRGQEIFREGLPHLRDGQALFLALNEINPELSRKLTATEADCFYDDKKIAKFYEALEENAEDGIKDA